LNEYTEDWSKYQTGLTYQAKINLLAQTDKNYRFYGNDHWKGVKNAEKLTLTIIPLTQQIVDLKVAVVMSDSLKMNFTVQGIADDTQDPTEQEYKTMAGQLSSYAGTTWENLKMDYMNEKGLQKSGITGDLISFWYWDELINAGNGAWGEMLGELINNVNYFPGDPNLDEINNAYGPVQPYILLSFRRQIEDVKKEAENNGADEYALNNITGDKDSQYQAGDSAKQGLDQDNTKCTVILKLWKEFNPDTKQYKIMARKSTRDVVIRDTWDTGLHRYPVAMMHWRDKEGSSYGEAEVTSLIPNQLVINKLASMIATWITKHGFPKVLFDKTRISSWTNDLSVAIGVNGTDTGGVQGAAGYMLPANLSSAVQNFMIWFIETTKKTFGANESILGEGAATNTSAIMVNSQNAVVPLNGQKHRFYNYVEDVGLIWLDFWLSKYKEYPNRPLEIMGKDENNKPIKQVVQFDANKLDGVRLKLKIDVGPSTQWNQEATNRMLDNLLQNKWITFVEYLERISDNTIPDTESLISARGGQANADKQLLYELVARFVATLTPEEQNQMQGMSVEEVKQQVEMMLTGKTPEQGGQNGGQQQMPAL
jgi:hypothetical protein